MRDSFPRTPHNTTQTLQPLVDAAVTGIDGRISARSSSTEGGKDTAEVALEIGGLSLRDRHPFADSSFADLLALRDDGTVAGSGAGSSLLSLSLRRHATQEGAALPRLCSCACVMETRKI